MFQQTYFYPSAKQHKSQRCKSEDDFAGWAAATAVPSTAKKTSSFMDLRKEYFGERFGLSSSSASTPTSIDVNHSTPAKGSTESAPNRFGSYPLAPSLVATLLPTSPLFSSPEHDHAKPRACSDADTATTGSVSISTSISSPTPSTLSNSSSLDGDGEADAIRFVLDNTEALPDWIANADHRRSEDEEDPDTTDTHWEEVQQTLARGANASAGDREYEYEEFEDDICSCCTPVLDNTSRPQQVFRQQQQQQQAFVSRERSSMTTTTTTETTTTTTTTTQSTTASAMEASQSVVSSTTIPQPGSPFGSPNPFSKPNEDHIGDLPSVGTPNHRGDNIATVVPLNECETNSAIATTRTSAVAARLPSCRSCASKQRKIERQRKELRHMKVAMSRLVLLLADAVRAQHEIGDDSSLLADSGELPKPKAITDVSHNDNNIAPATPVSCGTSETSVIGSNKNELELKAISDGSRNNAIVPATPVSCGTSEMPKPMSITDGSHNNAIVPATPLSCGTSRASSRGDNLNKEDPSSVETPAATPSSSVPLSTYLPTLQRRRIINMPVMSVGNDCPRTKKERILVNGRWGTYSGPAPSGKVENKNKCDGKAEKEIGTTETDHKSDGKIENDESKTETDNTSSDDESSPEAGIFEGCVVRLDEGELYVGSLSRNDTGSFTFHPPGTLYDRNRKPIRRIR